MAQVANCPNCHHPVAVEDLVTDAAKIAYCASQLTGHVFVLDTMMHHPAYAGAVEGYNERVQEMVNTMTQWVHDLQDWGNAYDEAYEDQD